MSLAGKRSRDAQDVDNPLFFFDRGNGQSVDAVDEEVDQVNLEAQGCPAKKKRTKASKNKSEATGSDGDNGCGGGGAASTPPESPPALGSLTKQALMKIATSTGLLNVLPKPQVGHLRQEIIAETAALLRDVVEKATAVAANAKRATVTTSDVVLSFPLSESNLLGSDETLPPPHAGKVQKPFRPFLQAKPFANDVRACAETHADARLKKKGGARFEGRTLKLIQRIVSCELYRKYHGRHQSGPGN